MWSVPHQTLEEGGKRKEGREQRRERGREGEREEGGREGERVRRWCKEKLTRSV